MQVGFLYLRYVCNPRDLWGWCERYVTDPEVSSDGGGRRSTVGVRVVLGVLTHCCAVVQEFAPSADGKVITLGAFLRDILLEQVSVFLCCTTEHKNCLSWLFSMHQLPQRERRLTLSV